MARNYVPRYHPPLGWCADNFTILNTLFTTRAEKLLKFPVFFSFLENWPPPHHGLPHGLPHGVGHGLPHILSLPMKFRPNLMGHLFCSLFFFSCSGRVFFMVSHDSKQSENIVITAIVRNYLRTERKACPFNRTTPKTAHSPRRTQA